MNAAVFIVGGLREHIAVCEEFLRIAERENGRAEDAQELRSMREALLPRLERSVTRLKSLRADWQRLSAEERLQNPTAVALMQAAQALVLSVLNLEKDNERIRLQRGLLHPREFPSANQAQPHFVADLYRRNLPE